MAEQDPLTIPIQFTTSAQNLQSVAADVQRAVGNVPLAGGGRGATQPVRSTPPPDVPAGGMGPVQAQSLTQRAHAAWLRGDDASANALAQWGQSQGVSIQRPPEPWWMQRERAVPTTRVGGGGFGPYAFQQYGREMGPTIAPDVENMRGRAEEHAEEFARQGRARADRGMALRERAFAHAEEPRRTHPRARF
jgi:hypothetical protein